MRTTQTTGAAAAEPQYLTCAEAAALARVDVQTIYRWVRDQRFRSARPVRSGSARRLVDRASFVRYLAGEVA
jgi:excisionase family DNA binding protein